MMWQIFCSAFFAEMFMVFAWLIGCALWVNDTEDPVERKKRSELMEYVGLGQAALMIITLAMAITFKIMNV